MKREGRQHGMVRTNYIMPPPFNRRRDVNLTRRLIDLPATAGLFTKVSPKPTNHSKFTGKCGKARCGGCHMHPVCKSKDKTKGNHKQRSIDKLANYQVMNWQAVDGRPILNFSGFSASAMLDHLASNYHDHEEDDDDDDEVDDNDEGHVYDSNHVFSEHEEAEGSAEEDKKNGKGGCIITQDKHNVGFSNGGLELDCVEVDEGWSLV